LTDLSGNATGGMSFAHVTAFGGEKLPEASASANGKEA
jgi:hypothetical protein